MAANGQITKVKRSEAQRLLAGEIGSALERDRLFVSFEDGEVFTPEDVTARKLERMLDTDGKARTLEQVLTLPLRGASYSIEPGPGDQGEAEFVRDVFTRPANAGGMSTPMDLVIAQMTSGCLFRRAFFEKVFKVDDQARVVLDKIAFRPASTCELRFDKATGGFRGFRQRVGDQHPGADENGKVTVPPDRALVFVYGQHRKPVEGLSDLDTAYAIWETKQKVKFLWMGFLENQVIPKAIAKSASGETTKLAQRVATLKGGGVLGIEKDDTVEAFESSGRGAAEFKEAINWLDGEMAGSCLAGFTGLPNDGKGSYALSKDQTDFFLQSRVAVLGEMAATLTGFALADLVRWNLGPGRSVPRFRFGPLVQENADKALEMLQSLASQPPGTSRLPEEFIDMLIEKVANYLGMDEGKVAQVLRQRRDSEAAGPTDAFRAGVDAATRLVAEAGVAPAASGG